MGASKSQKVFKYEGKKLNIYWDERLCLHAAECSRSEGELFVVRRDPWCQPDIVEKDEAKEICERCPSGALSYKDKESEADETGDALNSITVQNRGPLYLRGEIQLVMGQQVIQKTRIALCRCGKSENKPFCDNTHESTGFLDRGAVGTFAAEEARTTGPLKVSPSPHGPLLLSGQFVVRSSGGRTAFTGRKTALCRCGHSKNKPFCDGTHSTAGFRAE